MRSSIVISNELNPLDWSIFALVLLATFLAVVFGHHLKSRISQNEKAGILDYLVMGRALTLPLFVGTLVATWYGGIFGVTEIAFSNGIYNFLTQGIFWYLTYLIFAFVMVKRIRSSELESVTLPDLVSKLYGEKARKVAGFFNFTNVLPIAYVISLGLFLESLFGWSFSTSIILGASVVILYSLAGGFRAVVFSDFVQFFVMVSSVALVLLFSYLEFGGIPFLQSRLPDTHFDLTGGQPILATLVWGLIAMSTLVDPNFYQRCFAAHSDRVAKNGILISTLIWLLFDLCTTFGAMYARAVIPEANSSVAYLVYSIQVLPSGLKGFFLAGILATILSTLDSYLFVAGSTLAHDLGSKKIRNRKWTYPAGILLSGSIAVGLSFVFEGNVKSVWKTFGSLSAGCLLFPMIWGTFFKQRATERGFLVSTVFSAIAMAIWRNSERSGVWSEIDELYIGLFLSAFWSILLSRKVRLDSSSSTL